MPSILSALVDTGLQSEAWVIKVRSCHGPAVRCMPSHHLPGPEAPHLQDRGKNATLPSSQDIDQRQTMTIGHGGGGSFQPPRHHFLLTL